MPLIDFFCLEDIFLALPHNLSVLYDVQSHPNVGIDGKQEALDPGALKTICAFFNTGLSLIQNMPFDSFLTHLEGAKSDFIKHAKELLKGKGVMPLDEENLFKHLQVTLDNSHRSIEVRINSFSSPNMNILHLKVYSELSSSTTSSSNRREYESATVANRRCHVLSPPILEQDLSAQTHIDLKDGGDEILDDARSSDSDFKRGEDKEHAIFMEQHKEANVCFVNKVEMDRLVYGDGCRKRCKPTMRPVNWRLLKLWQYLSSPVKLLYILTLCITVLTVLT